MENAPSLECFYSCPLREALWRMSSLYDDEVRLGLPCMFNIPDENVMVFPYYEGVWVLRNATEREVVSRCFYLMRGRFFVS